ncbi:MAG: metal-dependent hydrolase [Candidatus Odinarchaeota archaeon]
MMPYSHFFSAIIVARLLQLEPLVTQVFIIAAVIPDLDYIPGIIYKRNHREYPPHYFILWFLTMVVAMIFSSEILFIFSAGGLFHLLFDLIDWGMKPLQPFHGYESRGLLTIDETIKSQKDFFRAYYSNRTILLLEIMLVALSVLLVFLN